MASTRKLPEPDSSVPKPDFASPNPPLRDRGIRLVMIPVFGVVIPHVTGYFGPFGPSSGQYWVGLAWSLAISFSIWHGNRFFLLKQRQHYDWFNHPARKIILLLFANVFYTAPLTIAMLLAWYRFAGYGPDWDAIRTITLMCLICVVFITHVYETAYLIRQRESDLLAVERLERLRAQAELDALKGQVAPHFLFNTLNALSWLIENNPRRALNFNQDLAEVYRYILVARRRELVPLEEEVAFLERYFNLLRLRFESAVSLDLPAIGGRSWYVPPISLQVLVENAVKHNRHPLRIDVTFEEDSIVVSNDRRPRVEAAPSSGMGLSTLDERCRLAIGRGIEIIDGAERFAVRVPVRAA